MKKDISSFTLFNAACVLGTNVHSVAALGCASSGVAVPGGWLPPDTDAHAAWDIALKGSVAVGTLEDVRNELAQARGETVYAGVVLFGNCGGENAFLRALGAMFPGVPFVGGAAAIGADGKKGRLLPHSAEVCVWLITDDRYAYVAESKNLHEEILCALRAEGDDLRHIDTVRVGEETLPLRELIARYAARFGVADSLCEHFTLSNGHSRNIHLMPEGGAFACGCDIPQDRHLLLRYTTSAHACAQMDAFFACDNALIFGCAGLKSLCGDHGFKAGKGSLGGFLFGETVWLDGASDFGNLMLSRLRVVPKNAL